MSHIVLHDVGLRDGLQIEEHVVPTDRKLRWLERLAASGLDVIQIGSFVNPQKVPQMADTDVLFRHLRDHPARKAGVSFTGLVLNEKGLERGLECGVDFFCMGVSASETHSRKNTGMSTVDATARIIAMGHEALGAGARVQVSVQSAFGCGFEGPVPAGRVLGIAAQFLDAGLTNVSLADTAGHADPAQVDALFGALLASGPGVTAACHFHDTYGLGLANVYAAWRAGVTSFECAFGGLGGCPFTAVAAGNVCTEDVVHLFNRLGLRTDVQIAPVLDVVADAEALLGRALPGTIHRTGAIPHGGRRDVSSPPPHAAH